jgi:hypothetical protein
MTSIAIKSEDTRRRSGRNNGKSPKKAAINAIIQQHPFATLGKDMELGDKGAGEMGVFALRDFEAGERVTYIAHWNLNESAGSASEGALSGHKIRLRGTHHHQPPITNHQSSIINHQ